MLGQSLRDGVGLQGGKHLIVDTEEDPTVDEGIFDENEMKERSKSPLKPEGQNNELDQEQSLKNKQQVLEENILKYQMELQ